MVLQISSDKVSTNRLLQCYKSACKEQKRNTQQLILWNGLY